jgi:hypothetical protein
MIVTFFINLLNSLVRVLLAILPIASPFPDAVTLWVGYFHTGLQLIGYILPLDQFFIIFGLWAFWETKLLLFTIAERIYKYIRG